MFGWKSNHFGIQSNVARQVTRERDVRDRLTDLLAKLRGAGEAPATPGQ